MYLIIIMYIKYCIPASSDGILTPSLSPMRSASN